MPRLARVSMEGVLYYITCRAPEGHTLFKDEQDFRAYMDLVRAAGAVNPVKMFAYVLMPNHLHLLLELMLGSNISDFMQSVNNGYTKHFNARHQRKGNVFGRRYETTYAEKETCLANLSRHIHRNPSRTKSGSDPAAYAHSNCGAYLAGTTDPERENGNAGMGEVIAAVRELGFADYEQFLKAADKNVENDLHKKLHRGGLLGSDEFIERMRTRLNGTLRAELESRELTNNTIPISIPIATPMELNESETNQVPAAASKRRSSIKTWIGTSLLVAAGMIVAVLGIRSVEFYRSTQGLEKEVEQRVGQRYELEIMQRDLQLRHKDEELQRMQNPRVGGIRTARGLNGMIWTIEIRGGEGSNGVQEDKIYFEDGKVHSGRFEALGYLRSNYTITSSDNETTVWETIQSGKAGGYVCWRGEMRNDSMKGVIIVQPAKGESTAYTFASKKPVEYPL